MLQAVRSKLSSNTKDAWSKDHAMAVISAPETPQKVRSPLSPPEVKAFKESVRQNRHLAAEVCSYLALNTLLSSEAEHEERKKQIEARGGSFQSNIEYWTREDLAWHVGCLAALYSATLEKAVSLPDQEWLGEEYVGPEFFAHAVEEYKLDQARAEAQSG